MDLAALLFLLLVLRSIDLRASFINIYVRHSGVAACRVGGGSTNYLHTFCGVDVNRHLLSPTSLHHLIEDLFSNSSFTKNVSRAYLVFASTSPIFPYKKLCLRSAT